MPRGIGFPLLIMKPKFQGKLILATKESIQCQGPHIHFSVEVTRNFRVDTMHVQDIPCCVKLHTLPPYLPKVAQTKYS